jgi:hypothetical protein
VARFEISKEEREKKDFVTSQYLIWRKKEKKEAGALKIGRKNNIESENDKTRKKIPIQP